MVISEKAQIRSRLKWSQESLKNWIIAAQRNIERGRKPTKRALNQIKRCQTEIAEYQRRLEEIDD
jgi:hypothetical protein